MSDRHMLSPSLAANPRLSAWVSFAGSGPSATVTVRTGKVELGQGIVTALTQIAAHALSVSPQRIQVAAVSTADSPDEGYTSGSLSIQHSGGAMRQAGYRVRAICHAAAADALGVGPEEVALADGVFSAPAGSLSYWDLPTAALLDRDITDDDAGEDVEDAGSSPGRELPRVNLPPVDLTRKVSGAACYLGDVALADQLHGRVVRPPARRAMLVEAPIDDVERMTGVYRVVSQRNFLAVLAEREEVAIRAAAALSDGARWKEEDTLPDESALGEFLTAATAQVETLFEHGYGNDADVPPDAADPAALSVVATFTRPFLAHASIATSTGLARFSDGVLEVWTSSQGIFHLRSAIAGATGLDPSTVIVRHVPSAGCYGHNGADDAAYDAVVLALAVQRPVRVVWSRPDELGWSPLAPAMRVRIEASCTPAGTATRDVGKGSIARWRQDIWSNGHTARPGGAVTPALLAAAEQQGAAIPAALDPPLARGSGSGRNGVPGYDLGSLLVRTHRLTAMPLRTSAMRALGAHVNVFAIESVLDELAALSGRDPLEFRLAHLRDPRGRRVLSAVAERAGWGQQLPGADDTHAETGRGIGYARYKGSGAYCAVVAEVEAGHELRVRRLALAVDVGRVVNTDGVINQIEGGAVQSLSWTLKERVRFDGRRVTSDTWESYPIVTFSEVPPVDVLVLPSAEPSLGAGEAACGPTAAAIGNAVAAAVGVRVRDLPLTTESVVRAITGD